MNINSVSIVTSGAAVSITGLLQCRKLRTNGAAYMAATLLLALALPQLAQCRRAAGDYPLVAHLETATILANASGGLDRTT